MDATGAVAALQALAQDSRLAVFRLLVGRGPRGMAAGQIAERLDVPATTLSFHLAQLTQAGLLASRREGRSILYAPDFGRMRELLDFLTENCCAEGGCAPAARPETRSARPKREDSDD
jgi:DNA-binding transcriptional ArsR family regulator